MNNQIYKPSESPSSNSRTNIEKSNLADDFKEIKYSISSTIARSIYKSIDTTVEKILVNLVVKKPL